MITKNDCMTVLVKLEDNGVAEASKYIKKLIMTREPSIEVLRFIAAESGFEIGNFFEVLRKSHNKRKSPLYTNILREPTDIKSIVTTLSCLQTQILLYASKLDNPMIFYRESRAEEISRALNNYFKTGELDTCLALLKLIKSDLLVMEYIAGKRDLV